MNKIVQNFNEYSLQTFSDSSDNEEINYIPEKSTSKSFKISGITMPRVTSPSYSANKSITSLSRAPIRRTNISYDKDIPSLLHYSDCESDFEYKRKDKFSQMFLNHRPGLNQGRATTKQSFLTKIRTFFQQLKRKTESNNFPTSSSNNTSFALILSVVLFFIVIFSIYFYTKFAHVSSKYNLDLSGYTFIGDKSKLLMPICSENPADQCIEFNEDRKPALDVVQEMKNYFDKTIYDLNCNATYSTNDSYAFLKSDVKEQIGPKLNQITVNRHDSLQSWTKEQLFDHDFNNALKLINLNSDWNIINNHAELILSSNYTINLPFKCRAKQLWDAYFWTILSTILAIFMGVLTSVYYRYRKKIEIDEQEQVDGLIEKSIEILQSTDEPQSMPVLHIRDTLLSPSERKSGKYKRIWDKVVNHIENSESRIKVEFKKIEGEDFKAWKWIATNTSYDESDADYPLVDSSQTQKISGVEWQGQAFALPNNKSSASLNDDLTEHSFQMETNSNKQFEALTRFLKIRNMFVKEAQCIDSKWNEKIKNTILAKTMKQAKNGKHNIHHIEIDDKAKEGLVFLKCGSISGATDAFHALHGWWCEKKLVSVKFMKEDRYYKRFPHAAHMNTPLTITSID